MQVNNKNTVTFSSYYNPIKSFKVRTSSGILHFSEVNYQHPPKNTFYKNLAEFFLDNFANTSSHPFWEKCRKPLTDRSVYDDYVNYNIATYKKAIKNKNTTILLAKDSSKNIVAAVFAKILRESPTVRDFKTLYIDSIAVSPKYRGNNVGESILNKVLESSKNRFTDVFLVSYKESVPFYKKLGFESLSFSNPKHKFVILEMAKERIDYPEYADFMYKSLNNSEVIPWYTRIQRNNIPKK